MYSFKTHKSIPTSAIQVEPVLPDLHREIVGDKVTLLVSQEKSTSYKNKGVERKSKTRLQPRVASTGIT